MPKAVHLILIPYRKKRDGSEYTDEEVRNIVDAILDEEMPEFQQSAWIMTNFFKGMSAQEIVFLGGGNDAFRRGDRNDGCVPVLRSKSIRLGVGDKTSGSGAIIRSCWCGHAFDEWI